MWRSLRVALVVCAVVAAPLAPCLGKAVPPAGNSSPGINRPNSLAYGKSLGEWLKLYWTWWITTGGDPASSTVGPVQFMPMPTDSALTNGTGTPDDPFILSGHVDITLSPGTPFVLAVAGFIYEEGPPDPPDIFGTLITCDVTLDGRPILQDLLNYFVGPIPFDEPLPSGDVEPYVFFEGIGFICAPLSPGVHYITVYDHFYDDWNVVFDNTWTIKVLPRSAE
jgi:hypothetical protein